MSADDCESTRFTEWKHEGLMDLTELPVLELDIVDPMSFARERLAKFWEDNPIPLLDQLNILQLEQCLEWTTQVNKKFSAILSELQQKLQNEWIAKEQVLDQLLQESIGTTINIYEK